MTTLKTCPDNFFLINKTETHENKNSYSNLYTFFSCWLQKKVDAIDEIETTTEHKSEAKNEKTVSENIKNCDDFLNTYEAWTNDLITLMEKHKDDPVTLATSPEYINTMMEGVSFMTQWEKISMSCATDDSYPKRMKVIQLKLDKRQKELGLK